MALFNFKFSISPLIGILVFSLWFFYQDYEQSATWINVYEASIMQEILLILVVIGGLYMIKG